MCDLVGRYCRMTSVVLGLACTFGSVASAADANAIAVGKVLTGLNNPQGVTVRPDGSGKAYEIFIAESGAGRVIKIHSEDPQKRMDVVSGFSAKPSKDDNLSSPGIYSLHFLDHMRLVVAGGEDDGNPFMRIYELPEPESPLTADQHKHEANVPGIGNEPKLDARVFRSIARTKHNGRVADFLLAAAQADDGSTKLISIPVHSGAIGNAVPTPLENANGEPQIGAITVGNTGYVTIATNSLRDSARPSRLAFVSPLDRRIVMQVPAQLQRIVALAYCPKSGNLFVANSPSNDEERGGIYRIDRVNRPGGPACIAAKLADVPSPTAIAFGPDGALYVTASGNRKSKNTGVLLKLTGDLANARK